MINTVNIPKAYSEVYAFMNALGENYIKKIPEKIYNIINDNRDLNYKPSYEKKQKLENGEISKEALALIAGLNLRYWCEDENEKKELTKCYINNSIQENEKYSYENLFIQEKDIFEENAENVANEEKELIRYEKNSVFIKLIGKIKEFYKKIIKY